MNAPADSAAKPDAAPQGGAGSAALMNTYARSELAFERGEGAWLIAVDGRRFLDFASGIAVTALGHCHPQLIKALEQQAHKIWHTSNLYRIPGQERLAERLVAATFAGQTGGQVFFGNSGVEAIECALKLVRKYHDDFGEAKRFRVIACEGSFHGRSLAALAAAGNAKYLKGYDPQVEGFEQVPFGNLNEMRAKIGPETAAILVEPVQGEGGMRAGSVEYLKGLRAVCDEFGLLLVFDEVQCGFGRTGKLFAMEHFDVVPDILISAKSLAAGLPLSAVTGRAEIMDAPNPGGLGGTYAGNPVAIAAAHAVIDVMAEEGLPERAQQLGDRLKVLLNGLRAEVPQIADVRGLGGMVAVEFNRAGIVEPDADFTKRVQTAALKHGLILLTCGVHGNVVRFMFPLTIPTTHFDEALGMLTAALRDAVQPA